MDEINSKQLETEEFKYLRRDKHDDRVFYSSIFVRKWKFIISF